MPAPGSCEESELKQQRALACTREWVRKQVEVENSWGNTRTGLYCLTA